jgi:hypothetical protein
VSPDSSSQGQKSVDAIIEDGVEVVAYENLTERGQELYVETLEAGGEYSVAQSEGTPDFSYPSESQRRAALEDRDRRVRPGTVVVERPVDGSLPDSDEEFFLDADEDFEGNRTELRRRAVVSLGTGGYVLSSKG